jgi:hypothetical protein
VIVRPDVQLAIDFVTGAIDGDYDVGVIASTDTDLVPAVDFVLTRIAGIRAVEVVAWVDPGGYGPRLQSKVRPVWCHYLKRADYDRIADATNYVTS